jgi:anti-sigma regulatory factor (Ser/Thr protein kinase)
MATVELSFTPLPAHVRTARLVATAVARRSGVAEPLLDEVRLAVGEACSRAVEAHRHHCPAEPVRIELSNDGGRFQVVVTDTVPGDGYPREQLASSSPSPLAAQEPAPEPVIPVLSAPVPGPGEGAAAGPPGAEAGDASALTGTGDGLPPGVGLAVISGLADDVQISATSGGVSIRMSWPVPGN